MSGIDGFLQQAIGIASNVGNQKRQIAAKQFNDELEFKRQQAAQQAQLGMLGNEVARGNLLNEQAKLAFQQKTQPQTMALEQKKLGLQEAQQGGQLGLGWAQLAESGRQHDMTGDINRANIGAKLAETALTPYLTKDTRIKTIDPTTGLASDSVETRGKYSPGADQDPAFRQGVDAMRRGLFGGGRAAGGPVEEKTPYLVGEKGPELFLPKNDGEVLPSDLSQGLIGLVIALLQQYEAQQSGEGGAEAPTDPNYVDPAALAQASQKPMRQGATPPPSNRGAALQNPATSRNPKDAAMAALPGIAGGELSALGLPDIKPRACGGKVKPRAAGGPIYGYRDDQDVVNLTNRRNDTGLNQFAAAQKAERMQAADAGMQTMNNLGQGIAQAGGIAKNLFLGNPGQGLSGLADTAGMVGSAAVNLANPPKNLVGSYLPPKPTPAVTAGPARGVAPNDREILSAVGSAAKSGFGAMRQGAFDALSAGGRGVLAAKGALDSGLRGIGSFLSSGSADPQAELRDAYAREAAAATPRFFDEPRQTAGY